MKNRRYIIANLTGLLLVFILMAVAAMENSGTILGYQFNPEDPTEKITTENDTVKINTTEICKDVVGYAGPVPVEIVVVNDTVKSVTPLKNRETPRYIKRIKESGFFDSWTGLEVEDALEKKVDGVTRATYSSKAFKENVRRGLATYKPSDRAESSNKDFDDPETIAALIVLLIAMTVPLQWKNKKYRIVQQLLNVGVLGFWSGTFINYTMLLQVVEMGVISTIITVLLFIVVFVYPLFGKKEHYCAWVCPLGSMQELASKCNPNHKLKLSEKAIKILTTFRKVLWGVLMFCLLTGIWVSWIDYELFTAFAVDVAPLGVVIAGGVFILLSVWIPRPYCRFVCPTGTLLKISQDATKR